MPKVFTTQDDSDRVEIAGVGVLGAGGQAAISVEDAALSMVELQQKDDRGAPLVGDDGSPQPLKGRELDAAAKEFADARGLKLADMGEKKLATVREDSGLTADRPPAGEVAQRVYEATYAGLQPVNADPEKVVANDGLEPLIGTPAPPPEKGPVGVISAAPLPGENDTEGKG